MEKTIRIYTREPAIRRALEAHLKDVSCVDDASSADIWTGRAADRPQSIAFADANIFVTPLRFGALADRVNMLRLKMLETLPVAIGDYIFDARAQELREGAKTIRLTEKETYILKRLSAAQGAVVSREDMLNTAWGYAEGVETHTLETHIYRLRQKIEADPAQPQILLTADQGYKLGV